MNLTIDPDRPYVLELTNNKTLITFISGVQKTDIPSLVDLQLRFPMQLIMMGQSQYLMVKWPAFRAEGTVWVSNSRTTCMALADDDICEHYFHECTKQAQELQMARDRST